MKTEEQQNAMEALEAMSPEVKKTFQFKAIKNAIESNNSHVTATRLIGKNIVDYSNRIKGFLTELNFDSEIVHESIPNKGTATYVVILKKIN